MPHVSTAHSAKTLRGFLGVRACPQSIAFPVELSNAVTGAVHCKPCPFGARCVVNHETACTEHIERSNVNTAGVGDRHIAPEMNSFSDEPETVQVISPCVIRVLATEPVTSNTPAVTPNVNTLLPDVLFVDRRRRTIR